jgi:ABC-2 type transport system ATP-binding protein
MDMSLTSTAIEIEGLTKTFRRGRRGESRAVDRLDLHVPTGGVFGFLGPNGSGKTTTIRCLLGLVRPTAGRMHLLGQVVPRRLPAVARHVGAIVETPAFFPTMSAKENLRVLAAIDRIGSRRVDALLEQVGLGADADRAVRKFSLGMRQRLGIAAALVKDPALLVLDEPANGLDPSGMREIRLLLRALAAEGRTVFVSSHLLGEIEQTCDAVAILRRGRCIASGPVHDVIGRADAGLLVRVDDLAAAARALTEEAIGFQRVDGYLRLDVPADEAGRVTRVLAARELWLTEMRPDHATLEERFFELTEPGTTDSGPDGADDEPCQPLVQEVA